MKLINFLLTTLTLTLSIAGQSYASNTSAVAVCSDCNLEYDYIRAATEIGLGGEDLTVTVLRKIFIINDLADEGRVYQVSSFPAEPGMPMLTSVLQQAPSSVEQAAIDSGLAALKGIRADFSSKYVVPSSVATSGFELADNTTRNQVVSNYLQTRNVGRFILDYRSALASVVTHFVNIQGTTVIEFADGVEAHFDITLVLSAQHWTTQTKLTLTRLLDENGHEIKFINGSPVIPAGTYSFPAGSDSLNAFIAAAWIAGIEITIDDFVCGDVCRTFITDLDK